METTPLLQPQLPNEINDLTNPFTEKGQSAFLNACNGLEEEDFEKEFYKEFTRTIIRDIDREQKRSEERRKRAFREMIDN